MNKAQKLTYSFIMKSLEKASIPVIHVPNDKIPNEIFFNEDDDVEYLRFSRDKEEFSAAGVTPFAINFTVLGPSGDKMMVTCNSRFIARITDQNLKSIGTFKLKTGEYTPFVKKSIRKKTTSVKSPGLHL